MSQQELAPLRRRRASLSALVSLGLVIAAIVPLAIALAFSEWQARPALISQANAAMESDATARVQLIDTYFQERQLDAQTLSQVPSVQEFLAASPTASGYQLLTQHALYALGAGIFRDKHYTSWALFDTSGRLRLYYPAEPQSHGKYMVPPEDFTSIQAGKMFLSAVYYSPTTQKASVDIYAPIPAPANPDTPIAATTPKTIPMVGFIRATLTLDYIWNIVLGDRGNNGKDSYAFILDENGVRVADTDAQRLFKSVQSLSPETEQRISQEERYGTSTPVPVLADSTLVAHLHNPSQLTTFQMQPTGQHELFQVVQLASKVVPWSYFVLSPVNTVTAVANKQLFTTGIIAATMALLIALIGLIAGQGITRPILSSVKYLLNSSQSLSTLAQRQQDAASEQMWVVDSSQIGLQSVQYYTQASRIAARELKETGIKLLQTWGYTDTRQAKQWIEQMITTAQYIENATEYQNVSNQKLATALKVATQVSEQLAEGATSATEAATQLELVVKQLRAVVGK